MNFGLSAGAALNQIPSTAASSLDAPRMNPPLIQQVERLFANLSELDLAVDQLAQRLQPICVSTPQATGGEAKDNGQALALITAALQQANERINETRRRVHIVLSELSL
jgi:hypothetical protein